ncbi:hypothetical protein [Xanthomonas albilineans]|uniref:Terminase small subunit n=1 Tax=Xanthomonas albilineans (strain GPE PC73 / CFBP 7063) TaxID=380358 RepID=D2U941_XANAP|nr:hypothetical protein [Xanthomonas albilineans]CBA14744.1 hypothetical protein XALC_0199 [Xanthomonas albilineans GPE PC73]
MVDPDLPETESFREFADRIGTKPSYVTELRKAGRLVLTKDGRRVCVAASLDRIQSTRNPAHAGVRARHAATRDATPALPIPHPPTDAPEAAQADASAAIDDDDLPFNAPHQMRRAKALADKEEALARKALREEQVEMGQLLVRDETLAAVTDAVVMLRSRLELIPPTLAPRMAALSDEDQVRVLLRDEIEQALEDLARKFSAIGKVPA